MTLIMRKLLASSTFAIAGALDSLARKLERQLRDDKDCGKNSKRKLRRITRSSTNPPKNGRKRKSCRSFYATPTSPTSKAKSPTFRNFRDLAVSISQNAKGQALLSALRVGFAKAIELGGTDKAMIFTESRRTQEYLVRLLSENGYDGKLVLFNGSNSDEKSKEIYKAWVERQKAPTA